MLKLAKNVDGSVEPGDISYADAAAATGCAPNEPACKDEVLGTLGVDEVIVTTVNAVPGGTEVKVKRLAKGTPPRESATLVPSSQAPDAKMRCLINLKQMATALRMFARDHNGDLPKAANFKAMDRQLPLLGRDDQRVGPRARLFRCGEHAGDCVAARNKGFQHRFAECLLTDDDDAHIASLRSHGDALAAEFHARHPPARASRCQWYGPTQ